MTAAIEAPSTASNAGEDRIDALVDRVREAAAKRTPLFVRGGSTKNWYGHRTDGAVLDPRIHAGVVDYEPSELVLVARAGTPLADVEALLASHGQMLAFEPPRFAVRADAPVDARGAAVSGNAASTFVARTSVAADRRATIGGCVAAGLSGPRRAAVGAVRDFVLGVRMIDGRGRDLSFGGRVMKNVAGYDVSRALAGSLGILGVVTEVALKVLPRPAQTVTVRFALDEAAALIEMNTWASLPIAISATAWRAPTGESTSTKGRLLVRIEGSEAAVQSSIRRIGGLAIEPADADAAWLAIREQTDAFFEMRPVDVPLWRVSLPSSAPPLDAEVLGFNDQLIEWGGALRWIASDVDASMLRRRVAALGGHATLWRASDERKARDGVFTPLSATSMEIHRRLKAELDPDRLFNRGRLYPDL